MAWCTVDCGDSASSTLLAVLQVHHINNRNDGQNDKPISTIPMTLHSCIFNVFLNLIALQSSQDLSRTKKVGMAANEK